jgi:hypothetical protein
MTPRQMRMPEKKIENLETVPAEYLSQRKRPDLGRFLLQVDRQTKGSYETAETAQSAAVAIKKDYPLLHVTVYDTLESATSII